MPARKSLTNFFTIDKDLLRTLCKLFYLQSCVSSNQRKNNVVAKILLAIREILYESNYNYNFYKFSYKYTFIPLFSFCKNQKQESNFLQIEGHVARKISDL